MFFTLNALRRTKTALLYLYIFDLAEIVQSFKLPFSIDLKLVCIFSFKLVIVHLHIRHYIWGKEYSSLWAIKREKNLLFKNCSQNNAVLKRRCARVIFFYSFCFLVVCLGVWGGGGVSLV